MAFFNRTEIGLKDTSVSANVPNDPRARLMFYLECVCSVLKLDDDQDVNRLRRYRQYYLLDRQDRNLLIQLCILLKPDILLNKCFFHNERLCGDSNNKFFELETVRNNLFVAGSVLVGGRNRQVTKIMTFKMSWIRLNWSQPLETLLEQQRQERLAAMRQQQASAACTIL